MTDVVKRVTIDTDGNVVENPRDQLIERLRAALGWVSARDHDVAIELDTLVEKLEENATADLRAQLEVVRKERDAAWSDLYRIHKLVRTPMVLMENEFKTLQVNVDATLKDLDDLIEHSPSGQLVQEWSKLDEDMQPVDPKITEAAEEWTNRIKEATQ
jgi:hypothetical protein